MRTTTFISEKLLKTTGSTKVAKPCLIMREVNSFQEKETTQWNYTRMHLWYRELDKTQLGLMRTAKTNRLKS